ncbi:MAG: hypothetical protein KBD00_00020 [Candidatus Peribacteraceae bacterium]|nr:hypothetical protein [Candidatus Peribacteraceae bacterium]
MLKKLLLPACFAPITIALLLSACGKSTSNNSNDISAALSSAIAAKNTQNGTETGSGITRSTPAPSLRTLFYGSTIESYQTLDEEKNVIEAGIFVPVSAIEDASKALAVSGSSLPAPVIQLDLPAEVKKSTYLDHVEIAYIPTVKNSTDPYAPGHFAFHFLTVTPDQQNKINCLLTLDVSADRFPDSFAMNKPGLPPTGDCVPFFGNRAIDIAAPEQDLVRKPLFTHTMAFQYYSGRIVALTPMITPQEFAKKMTIMMPIKQPITIGKDTLFPSLFKVTYDRTKKAYKLAFSEWVMMK